MEHKGFSHLKDKMDEVSFTPPPNLWDDIEKELDQQQKPRRPWGLLLLFLFSSVAFTGIGYYFGKKSNLLKPDEYVNAHSVESQNSQKIGQGNDGLKKATTTPETHFVDHSIENPRYNKPSRCVDYEGVANNFSFKENDGEDNVLWKNNVGNRFYKNSMITKEPSLLNNKYDVAENGFESVKKSNDLSKIDNSDLGLISNQNNDFNNTNNKVNGDGKLSVKTQNLLQLYSHFYWINTYKFSQTNFEKWNKLRNKNARTSNDFDSYLVEIQKKVKEDSVLLSEKDSLNKEKDKKRTWQSSVDVLANTTMYQNPNYERESNLLIKKSLDFGVHKNWIYNNRIGFGIGLYPTKLDYKTQDKHTGIYQENYKIYSYQNTEWLSQDTVRNVEKTTYEVKSHTTFIYQVPIQAIYLIPLSKKVSLENRLGINMMVYQNNVFFSKKTELQYRHNLVIQYQFSKATAIFGGIHYGVHMNKEIPENKKWIPMGVQVGLRLKL